MKENPKTRKIFVDISNMINTIEHAIHAFIMQIQNVVQIRCLIEFVFLAVLPDQFFRHPVIVIRY